MTKTRILFLVCTVLSIIKTGLAQLRIDTSRSAEYMVKVVLAGKEVSSGIENVKYRGDKKSLGIFHYNTIYNKMISRGIILSTGDVFDAIGPNENPDKGSKSMINSDKELGDLASGPSIDAAILEFDFIPLHDSICFNFFFASEEYPEYVKKNMNDVFGFFLSCEELNLKKNLAVLEDNIPITIDNINAGSNSSYFIRNYSWDQGKSQKWKDNKAGEELARTLQFDGLTILMHARSRVVPNKKYHIKLAISDVGDRLYDSAIFLEAGSFKSASTKKDIPFEQSLKDEFGGKIITGSNNEVSLNLNINFEADSFRVSGNESFALLNKVLYLLNAYPGMQVVINGHTDDSGTKEHNKILSLNRAKDVAGYLISKGLEPERVTYKGHGDSKPLSSKDKKLNRRVEFAFIKGSSGN